MNNDKTNMRKGMKAELKNILPRFEDATSKTQDGQGDTMRLVIDIPVEIASMATWMDYQWQAKYNDLSPEIDVDFPPFQAHKLRAKKRLSQILWNWYQEELHYLVHEMHPVLYNEEKSEPLPENVISIDKKTRDFDNFDDDIPF